MNWLTIILVLLASFAHGQNLVVNGGFEIFEAPPNYVGQINRATGWGNINGYYPEDNPCPFPIICATPDYFIDSQFSSWDWNGVSQSAFEGEGLVHIGLNFWNVGYYEYIHTELSEPLSAGVSYRFSMFLSVGYVQDSSVCSYTSNGLGVLFCNQTPIQYGSEILELGPQLTKEEIFIDDLWTEWIVDFIADSSYSQIVIGSFDSFNTVDTIRLFDCSNTTYGYAHYFLDNISLIRLDTLNAISNYSSELFKILIDDNQIVVTTTFPMNNYDLSLTEITGRISYKANEISKNDFSISTIHLHRGIYVLKIHSSSGIISKKIVIQ